MGLWLLWEGCSCVLRPEVKSPQRILLNTQWVLAQLSSHPILGRLNQLLAKREIEKIRLPITHKCWCVSGVTCLLTPLVSVVGTRTVAIK